MRSWRRPASDAARSIDTVYLVGGFFFSLGGYASVLQAGNAPTDIDQDGSLTSARWRWWDLRPHNLGWLSAAVLFLGTLLFAVSLVAAFGQNLTVRQANTWIWIPDMLGCVCFLVSGHLALLEICHGRIGVRLHEIGWWIVFVNQVGSVLFFLAGLAAYTRPAHVDRARPRRRQLGHLPRCRLLRHRRRGAGVRQARDRDLAAVPG